MFFNLNKVGKHMFAVILTMNHAMFYDTEA